MGLFGPKHQILELPQIPRERKLLQSMINEARAAARKSKVITWASGLIMVVGVCILISAFSSAMPKPAKYHIYMPISHRTSERVDQLPTPFVINDSNPNL